MSTMTTTIICTIAKRSNFVHNCFVPKLKLSTIHPTKHKSSSSSRVIPGGVASTSATPKTTISVATANASGPKATATLLLAKIRALQDTAFSPRFLIYTNLALGMVLAGSADAILQLSNRARAHARDYDLRRTANMTIAAMPTLFIWHHWYIYLDKKWPSPALRTAMVKMVLDAGIMAPICWGIYLATFWFVDARRIEAMNGHEATAKIGRMYLAEWCVWPPAQIVNFYYLPTRYRIAFVGVVALFMELYWSYLLNDFQSSSSSSSSEISSSPNDSIESSNIS